MQLGALSSLSQHDPHPFCCVYVKPAQPLAGTGAGLALLARHTGALASMRITKCTASRAPGADNRLRGSHAANAARLPLCCFASGQAPALQNIAIVACINHRLDQAIDLLLCHLARFSFSLPDNRRRAHHLALHHARKGAQVILLIVLHTCSHVTLAGHVGQSLTAGTQMLAHAGGRQGKALEGAEEGAEVSFDIQCFRCRLQCVGWLHACWRMRTPPALLAACRTMVRLPPHGAHTALTSPALPACREYDEVWLRGAVWGDSMQS